MHEQRPCKHCQLSTGAHMLPFSPAVQPLGAAEQGPPVAAGAEVRAWLQLSTKSHNPALLSLPPPLPHHQHNLHCHLTRAARLHRPDCG